MRILIVGCGRMGGWFASRLSERGFEVTVYDKRREKAVSLAKRLKLKRADGLENENGGTLVAVPIEEFESVAEQLLSCPSKPLWVMEVSSFKQPIVNSLRRLRRKGFLCVSAHPLFGPSVKDISGTTTAHVSPAERRKERKVLETLLPGTKVVEVDAKTHDLAMHYAITLTHLIGISYALSLKNAPKESAKLVTNSMRKVLELSAIALNESPSLYSPVTFSNKDAVYVHKKMVDNLTWAMKSIREGEAKRLISSASRGLRKVLEMRVLHATEREG